jgi:Cof subfamily protein (haloacid dehalogenase superfamily)
LENDKKIIFFDIDGTLYDPSVGVLESTKEGIRLLLENGHIPVICTGRTRSMISKEITDLGFLGIIAGAGTYVEYEGKVLHHSLLKVASDNELLKLFKDNNVHYIVEGPDYVYYDPTDTSIEYEAVKGIVQSFDASKVKPLPEGEYTYNKYVINSKPDDIHHIIPYLEEHFDLICHETFIELAQKGYNKAVGISKMIEYLNIKKENTYAFGDSTNDIEMLEFVEYGIAMGNSYQTVLENAKYKTKSIIEDGIYYGLKEFNLI